MFVFVLFKSSAWQGIFEKGIFENIIQDLAGNADKKDT